MKIWRVRVLKEAGEDLEMARIFYDEQEKGLGNYFFESLLSDLESLKLYAGIHSRRFGLHRMFSKRFPFAIYYQTKATTAWVAAILDMRRNPSWIFRKLEKRKN